MSGKVAITFRSYLMRLKEIERVKPADQRRKVPSVSELARLAGLKHNTGSRLMNGHALCVSLDKLYKVICTMRKLGFEMEITDFLTYMEFEDKPDFTDL